MLGGPGGPYGAGAVHRVELSKSKSESSAAGNNLINSLKDRTGGALWQTKTYYDVGSPPQMPVSDSAWFDDFPAWPGPQPSN